MTVLEFPRGRLLAPLRLRSALAALVGLVLSGAMACVSRPALVVPENLEDRDIRLGYADPKNQASGDFAEQIVVRGRLSDGGSVYSKLTVSNIANTDGRADFNVDIKLADGRRAQYRARKDRGDWSFDKDRFAAEIGKATIEVGVGRSRIVVDDDAFKLEFSVESDLPALRPSGGLFDLGGAFYVTTLPIPRGRMTIALEVREPLPLVDEGERAGPPGGTEPDAPSADGDGADDADGDGQDGAGPGEGPELPETIEAEGVGFAEHRAGNLPPYRLAHAWYNILHITDELTLVMSAFERKRLSETPPSEQGRARGWLIVVNDEGLVLYEPELDVWAREVTADEVTGYSLPGLVYLADPERRTFKGVIKTGSLSERKDDLSNLKRLERVVVRRLMKPWTFFYNQAQYLFRRQPPGEPMVEQRGAARFLYQQIDE